MDRLEEATNVVIEVNRYRNHEIQDYELIKSICAYFDLIKGEDLSDGDLRFLKYLSNTIGIPHFFDLLDKFTKQTEISNIDLNTLSSIIYESTLSISKDNKVHKYQKEILELFRNDQINRFFLSASTSFGKTHIVYEVIRKVSYKNIVLIFPTIALLSENLERLATDPRYQELSDRYMIHTLSEVPQLAEHNIFIYTPERFLSFMEKDGASIQIDFSFVDEVYKIDNDYLIDEEAKENERDVAYRLAVFYCLKGRDVLLAGPYIEFSKKNEPGYNGSFDTFLRESQVNLIDYNNYEIVNKSFTDIKTKTTYEVDSNLKFVFDGKDKKSRLIEILNSILRINENSIVYCYSRNSAESYAKDLIETTLMADYDTSLFNDFIVHVSKSFKEDWVVISALKRGIGIHHGLIPKYIQKEIVSLFNLNLIKILISTTTITEGVNTSAKNLVVLHHKKGKKDLKKFDARNIAGRAGRFLQHYSGRVLVLQNKFMEAINSPLNAIKHKNFDLQSPKDEIDLYYTGSEYLIDQDKKRIEDIAAQQALRAIPDFVFDLYKVVSRVDKILVYDKIKELGQPELDSIRLLIRQININLQINREGFQTVINVIAPIVKNNKVKFLIENKRENDLFSTLTHLTYFYLSDGFISSINYKIQNGANVDEAISETAEFVYNILKYQVVKYLGVFNVMYKLVQSQAAGNNYDDINGIERLLIKLEYNAVSEEGRIVSDYGVPNAIVEYYENPGRASSIKATFDQYENSVFEKIQEILASRSS
jgi:hypothetical protein